MSGGEQQKTSVVFFLLIFSRVPNKKKNKIWGFAGGRWRRARARAAKFFLGRKKK
jgi:hypothetical protein